MWYPGAFDQSSQDLIRSSFDNSIEIDLNDALLFACNCVTNDRHLYMPAGTNVSHHLRDIGYKVWEGDFSEFLKAGGAAKCLTLHIRSPLLF